MTALHLVRMPLGADAFARWAGERGWGSGHDEDVFDEGRALHHLLAEAFSPGAVRSFRLLAASRSGSRSLYLYSSLDADALRAAAEQYAPPEHLGVLPLPRLESKPLPQAWYAGLRLGFDLRVRPVRRLRMIKITEIDAFLAETLRGPPEAPQSTAGKGRSREAVYLDWLQERLGRAAALERENCNLVRFHLTRVLRGQRLLQGPDATIHGTLAVADPDRFAELLQSGIGRHRAFGYGMLLLRAPGRAERNE